MTPAQVKTAADDLTTALDAGDATAAEINENTAAPGLADSLTALAESLVELLASTGRGAHYQKAIKLAP